MKDLLQQIVKRYSVMRDADRDNRDRGMYDFKFINIPGKQWDDELKAERGRRPCYEFNKLRVTASRIINDMRANTPQGKVRGVEGGDKDVAEIFEGLIRNIMNVSDSDTIFDYAAEYQVAAGIGSWRLNTRYVSDTSFNQEIVLEPIDNPFCLYGDPAAKDMLKVDAQDWIITEKISKKEFKARYPRAEKTDFEMNDHDDAEDWRTDDEIRIAEYWYKEPTTKTIYELIDGTVVDSESDEGQIIATQPEMINRKRDVKTHKIMSVIASGAEILEGPTEWAGTMFPFIQIYGEYKVIDGELIWHGIGRFAKDAQRSYNVSRTAITETIALAPTSKFWATETQADGHLEQWKESHKKNFPFQLYNPDPLAPGSPQRMGGPDVPVALIQESQLASEEINMVTGIFAADVGAVNNANSGRQEIARQQQGAVATFNYQDNRAKGIKRTWDLLIDLIPKVYDTQRELRVLGSDGVEDYKTVNKFVKDAEGNDVKINDLSVGRYDTTVTVGPSFTTKRQEAAETYQQLLQGNPQIWGVAGDLIFRSMDLPYAEDIAERLKIMLPPQIQQMINEDQEIPPEVMAMMEQANQAMQQVEQQAMMIQEEAQKVEQESSEVEINKRELEKMMVELDKQKATFEAFIQKELNKIMSKVSQVKDANNQIKQEAKNEAEKAQADQVQDILNNQLAQEMGQSINAINAMAQQFIQAMAMVQPQRKIIRIDQVRDNGVLTSVPIYEDEQIQ